MLTQEDFNTLLEAVELWKDMMPMEGNQLGEIVQGFMSGDKEQAMARVRAAAEEAGRKHRSRKEQGILLQAKLIQMRDKADLQEVAEFIKHKEPPI